jgi:hypothetical protein
MSDKPDEPKVTELPTAEAIKRLFPEPVIEKANQIAQEKNAARKPPRPS